MFPVEFVPVEFRGMSIITAIILSSLGLGLGFYYTTIKREFKRVQDNFKRVDKVLEAHDEKLDKNHDDIGDMKTNIALIHQSTTRIEKLLENK